MDRHIRHAVKYAVIAIFLVTALFVVAQVAQLVSLAARVHPFFGAFVGLVLVGALTWLVAVPVLAYARLAPALVPPTEASGPQHDAFVAAYLAACRTNPHLEGHPLESEDDLGSALKLLTTKAEAVVNRTAARVFLGSAISQYGALDTLVVAALQLRMVWQVAHIYQSRPSLKHIGYLYTNVLVTSVVASNLDKLDVSAYLQPLIVSMAGQGPPIPGVTAVTSRLSNAVFQGSVNAFLTLRVGMVAIAYSNSTSRIQRGKIWHSAVARAGGLLVKTVAQGTVQLAKAVAVASKDAVVNTALGAGQKVVDGATAIGEGVVTVGQVVGSATGTVASAVGAAAIGTASTVGSAASIAAGAVGTTAVTMVSAAGVTATGVVTSVASTGKKVASAVADAPKKGLAAVSGTGRSIKRAFPKKNRTSAPVPEPSSKRKDSSE